MLLLFKLFVSFSILYFHPNQVIEFQFVILIMLVILGSLHFKCIPIYVELAILISTN